MTDRFLARLLDEASRPFRAAGHFAYHFSRGKLGGDCIFRELLRQGVFPPAARFLDLGCGQAVFASWLLAARRLYERNDWPAQWPQPPQVLELRGLELMASDVARANAALGDRQPQIVIRQGDIRQTDFGQAEVVVILDVLHYIDYAGQEDILRRVQRRARTGRPAGDAGRRRRRRPPLPLLQLGGPGRHLRARPSPADALLPPPR